MATGREEPEGDRAFDPEPIADTPQATVVRFTPGRG
jgi:hypothetical protein